jgi:cardiolipin synthase
MKRRTLWPVVATFVATVIGTIVLLNLLSGESRIDQQIEARYATHDPQFRRPLSALLGPPLVEGNSVEELLNGEQIFPAMLASIRQAAHSISFETYIYWPGSVGREFADALCGRARAGLAVHALLDGVGSTKMDEELLNRTRLAGAQVVRYHRPRWWDHAPHGHDAGIVLKLDHWDGPPPHFSRCQEKSR